MEYLKSIETETSSIGLRDDGIIEATAKADFKGAIKIAQAVEAVKALQELCTEGPRPLLAHMQDNELTEEARAHFFDNMVVSATALVLTSFVARMMASIILELHRPSIPVKLFSSQEKAIEWLHDENVAQLSPVQI